MAPKSEKTGGIVGFIKTKAMPPIFFCLAIYTLVVLITTALEVGRSTLKLSKTPPSKRCVTFFDKVVSFVEDHSNTTDASYDYMAGTALCRICSSENGSVVDNGIGEEYKYNPIVDYDSNCDYTKNATIKQDIINNCNRYGLIETKGSNYTCDTVWNYGPGENGLFWAWGVYHQTSNVTDPKTKDKVRPPKCTFKFVRLDYEDGGRIPRCPRTFVGMYHKKAPSVTIFLWVAVAIPVFNLIFMTWALYKFADGIYDPLDDMYLGFALRGIPGPIYKFFWMFCSAEHKGQPFPPGELSWKFWALCVLEDVVCGPVAAAVALAGCALTRFPVPFTLMILKICKILWDAYTFFTKDGDDEKEEGTTQQFHADYAQQPEAQPAVQQYSDNAV